MLMASLSHYLSRVLVACSCLATCVTAAAADRPAVGDFFRSPDVGFVRISPSGRYVVILNRTDDGQQVLAVRDTADLKKVTIAARYEAARLVDVSWINDERLAFTLKNPKLDFIGNFDQFAVDRDGANLVRLIAGSWGHKQQSTGSNIKDRTLTADYIFLDVTHDGSDDIIVGKMTWNNIDKTPQSVHPFRLNTRTRELADMMQGAPENVHGWIFDASDQARIAISGGKGRCIVHYRSGPGAPWEEMSNRDCYKDGNFQPMAFDGQDRLYVRAGYKDRMALFAYDLKAKKLGAEPFVDIDGFDFAGSLKQDYAARKILGVYFTSDASSTVWLDPVMKGIQEQVDAQLPGTVNRVQCGRDCRNPPAVTVVAQSDRSPPAYFVYTPANGKLIGLGSSYPAIDPKRMGQRDFVRYAARDGLQIPMYVTVPAGKAAGPRPAVVLVHGGPYVRGASWEWDREAQFLASRGYVVLQPEFRGSTGFGTTHFRAGWQQWGRTMQDDLTDAADWAVKQGLADPARIGIMGASYGGYATLMGLVRNPDTFRAGIEWAGVTDIGLLFDTVQSDASEDARRYSMKEMIGDPDTQSARFQEVSPLAQAARIKRPLLMAHGAFDVRVPMVHATRFGNAVREHNPDVEYVIYPDEGHGWRNDATHIDFWTRVEAFLDKNLAR